LAANQLTGPIRLLVSDVDGTMVTTDKTLLPATIAAAHRLRAAGIHLALVSSRPPRGMMFLQEELGLTGPLGGFNGGTILAGDGSVIEENRVPEEPVRITLDLLAQRGVGAWLFADNQWLIKDPNGDYVPKERRTVRFEPTVVSDFEPYVARCGKVVGASSKFDVLAECESELHTLLHGTATAHRSQKYYLDLTHPAADKGTALQAIAKWYGFDPAEVACIGDMTKDVPMFRVAGLSIAMGNAPPAVAAEAMAHTGPNDTDGWAEAIDRLVLPRAP
jgi:Cof subfamily protein (haloacid dehalogenase superfamily)